ncbi:MAG: polysaccharide deacetylase family protein, partial [Pseudomonadota bacterium]
MNPTAGKSDRPKPYWRRALDGVTRRIAGTITGVEGQSVSVALTFDDGPDPEYTPRLLDLLGKHNACAT